MSFGQRISSLMVELIRRHLRHNPSNRFEAVRVYLPCPFGKMASAPTKLVPTPFCRRDTEDEINSAPVESGGQ